MCGIAGIYNFKRRLDDTGYIDKCLLGMLHRGPDAQKKWYNESNYITGFVRLSIRDLSEKGNQPMVSDCGGYVLSFNGEIYNTELFLSLLKPYRSDYHSSSDTELLLYALIHLGIERTLAVADGMFAFAFYDINSNHLILARDRLGVKPLYAGISKEGVVYSSQYDHVINHPYFSSQALDASVMATYLQLGYMPEGTGVKNGTQLLPHGHYLSINEKGQHLHSYYEYSISSIGEKGGGEPGSVLKDAVSSELASDVPIGTFMSGGVDSSLVSYYANSHKHFKAFTLGVAHADHDESNMAKAFATYFEIDHYCRDLTQDDMKSCVADHFKAYSEPFADYSSIPTLQLAAFAKKHVTVALSGDGADELFWGYSRSIKALKLLRHYEKNGWQRKVNLLKSKVLLRRGFDIGRHWGEDNFYDYYYSTLAITGSRKWLPKVIDASPCLPFFYQPSFKDARAKNDQQQASHANIIRKIEVDIHLQRILLKVDRASMFHSLEVRVPFLSNRLLEYSQNCSYKDCIHHDEGKWNLKHHLSEISRGMFTSTPKKGFSLPIDEWLRNDFKKDVIETIADMPSDLGIYFNKKQLHSLLRSQFVHNEKNGWFVWALYALIHWNQHHNRGIS